MNDDRASKTISVLHVSPHHEDDGIAVYQEQYLAGMAALPAVKNQFFEVSPLALRIMAPVEQEKVYTQLKTELQQYDILHIQHEFGLFAENEFRRIVELGKAAGKKVVVSVHLSPGFAIKPVKLGGLGPRSILMFLRQKRYRRKQLGRHMVPFKLADLLLVHNETTRAALERVGIDPQRIKKIQHPVPVFTEPPVSKVLAKRLNKKPDDVLLCTVGMLHRFKGTADAIKALKFLPDNYKLAIIGGMHPISDDVAIYNKLCDLIDVLGLHQRVYITGFVKDSNHMNALIRECDVCLYPYDGTYYAHLSSGSINLAISNNMPVIAYPTLGFKEVAQESNGAVILTDTFAYYELVRELERVDSAKQRELARAYAKKMAWPVMAKELVAAYQRLV